MYICHALCHAGHAHHSHDVTDKSDLGTVDLSVSGMLSPPCTCGAGEDSEPEIETTRRLPVPEERRPQAKEIEAGRHSQERRYRASQASSDVRNKNWCNYAWPEIRACLVSGCLGL